MTERVSQLSGIGEDPAESTGPVRKEKRLARDGSRCAVASVSFAKHKNTTTKIDKMCTLPRMDIMGT